MPSSKSFEKQVSQIHLSSATTGETLCTTVIPKKTRGAVKNKTECDGLLILF